EKYQLSAPSTTFTKAEINDILKEIPRKLGLIPVGSYLFKTNDIGDIDLLTKENLDDVLKELSKKFDIIAIDVLAKKGKELFFTTRYKGKDIKFNIWRVEKEDYWPYMLFAYSYQRLLSIKMRAGFKRKGYTLTQHEIRKGNQKITEFTDDKGK